MSKNRIENIQVFGWEPAVRGMRNPMNSWGKIDSEFYVIMPRQHGARHTRVYRSGVPSCTIVPKLGPNDLKLMKNLIRAGSDERKFLRMLHVFMDITAPLYWWKDFDTYKVGTVANSCSTMHKIHDKEFVIEDFAYDKLDEQGLNILKLLVESLNAYRNKFLESGKKDKEAWYNMIQLLPTSYLQKRTVDVNYEMLVSFIKARRYHKQEEFRLMCEELLDTLPYLREFVEASENK